jgi:MerR family transcriptional regulator, light-induced transcriptional regulator
MPLAELAREYLDLLLAGERSQASRLIQEAVDDEVAVKDIYLHVFQRTQHEVGRLWQINQISVAHEHYCTAATQLIMSQLYPHIMSGEKTGRRLVMTCVKDELHELGARMVADFFEMEGWDTYYLGANTPTPDILSTLDEKKPDLLGISTTITYNLDQMNKLIKDVKSSPFGENIPVLVGGRPFNIDPNLYETIGADGQAPDAGTALRTADQLIQEMGE